MKYEEFEKLLMAFKQVDIQPQKKRRQTFMTVSGYPHIENVASNVLAFFFNDTEEHGFENLWLKSLLECANYEDASNVHGSWCNREVSTIKGNRIDIVIYSDTTIITLENKLFSFVHNDLQDYSKTVKQIAKAEDLKQVDILLTLYDEQAVAEKKGFINITYSQLFECVRKNIGEYLDRVDNTWLLYAKDFMFTIDGLLEGESTNMDKEFARFLHDNYSDLNELMYKIDSHKKDLKKETEKISGLLQLNEILQNHRYSVFCYNSKNGVYSCICIDITRADKSILTVETFVDVEGWHVTLFDRKGKEAGKIEIQKRLNENQISFEMTPYESKKMQVACCKYGAETTEILEAIYKGVSVALQIL